MKQLDSLFFAHPRSVGESYGQHFATALSFAVPMISGGLALLVHAVLPGLFVRTGSNTIKRLYGSMKRRQPVLGTQAPAFESGHWQMEYEI